LDGQQILLDLIGRIPRVLAPPAGDPGRRHHRSRSTSVHVDAPTVISDFAGRSAGTEQDHARLVREGVVEERLGVDGALLR
jgi:hypothetical protein